MPPQLKSSAGQQSGSSFLLPLKKQSFEYPALFCPARDTTDDIAKAAQLRADPRNAACTAVSSAPRNRDLY
jgi:hypothetical protein